MLGGHSSDPHGQGPCPGGADVLTGEQQAMNKSPHTPGGRFQARPSAREATHPGIWEGGGG